MWPHGTIRAAAVLVVGSLAFAASAYCQANPDAPELSVAVDLPLLRRYALANNPEIQAAQRRWWAAQARPSQEGSLPDPMVNTAYQNEGFERLQRETKRIGVEQEIPFPGKLSLRQEAAAREADREGASYRARSLNVLTRLRLAYDDYFLAWKSLEIVRANQELLEKLTATAEARYKVGEGLQQDVARAEVELSILIGQLTRLGQEKQSAQAVLNGILNRPPTAPLGKPAPVEAKLPYTLEELERVAEDRSPNLMAAGYEVARAEKNLDLARRQYYPDFVLRADYFNRAPLVPEWEVSVGIRLPLYFWRKQAFGVREAQAALEETRASRQATTQEILAALKDFYAQATSAQRLVDLYGAGVVPQAEVALRSAQAAYQVGRVDFLTLLNSFTVLNEFQVEYYRQVASLDKAVAQLEEAAGIFPEGVPAGGPP